MIFTEFRFVFFFALVFVVHWAIRSNRGRKLWLLAASYAFYAAWDWRFLSLIWISTAVDYVAGLRLAAITDPSSRRKWIAISVAANLSILGVFKYFNFFAGSLFDLLAFLGVPASFRALDIVLPVGISFYTFQTMSYSLDVYRRRLDATRSLLDLALFVGFFPQLVAGPIVRAKSFLPQLSTLHRFTDSDMRSSLVLFLVGFVKKACVSDNVAPIVDRFFASPGEFTAASAWIATLLYAVQIYCDFSGYSDMAVACARMLGFEIGDNFNFPYLATSIRDFWRRWHISLSTWLRDYLYISLGGNRGSRFFTLRNLMITMLLGGLWHGASWNFVIWGGLHGLALAAQREWSLRRGERQRSSVTGRVIGLAVTFYWVCLTWILFRAESLADALITLRAFVLLTDMGARSLDQRLLLAFIGLAATHLLGQASRRSEWWRRVPAWSFAFAYGIVVAVALALIQPGAQPFIYFQF